jgi:hypothetical protein
MIETARARRLSITLTAIASAIILVRSPAVFAQTPDPAAGNPAINTTPVPSSGNRVTSGMTNGGEPNNAAISNPSPEKMRDQNAKLPERGNGDVSNMPADARPNASDAGSPMPQGRYALPPTDLK